MTLIIVTILFLGYLLIATERLTNVNKAAVAVFAGTVGWVLYICFGADFVMSQHSADFMSFLNDAVPTSTSVKHYIAQNIFLKYVGKAAEIVLFLIATMTIVEILHNNGCFDFINAGLRTRKCYKFLWVIATITFILSANLDNLTTTVMMLTIMVLWNMGAVTATSYSASLALPCLIAWILPTWWIGRSLPERMEVDSVVMPYRGDDTNLNVWQRLLMLVVGIGGLWFIPTFHNITKLSPFLGALCVLSILWVVNEIFNRKLMNVDVMIQRRIPRVLQYGVIQMILFVMGMMLAIGVVKETGVISAFASYIDRNVHDVWLMGIGTGVISTLLDNFATAMSSFSLYSVADVAKQSGDVGGEYLRNFVQNGAYWKIMAYTSVIGGNILVAGSMSGLALIKAERIHLGWYFKNVGWMAMVGGFIGLGVMWLTRIGI